MSDESYTPVKDEIAAVVSLLRLPPDDESDLIRSIMAIIDRDTIGGASVSEMSRGMGKARLEGEVTDAEQIEIMADDIRRQRWGSSISDFAKMRREMGIPEDQP